MTGEAQGEEKVIMTAEELAAENSRLEGELRMALERAGRLESELAEVRNDSVRDLTELNDRLTELSEAEIVPDGTPVVEIDVPGIMTVRLVGPPALKFCGMNEEVTNHGGDAESQG